MTAAVIAPGMPEKWAPRTQGCDCVGDGFVTDVIILKNSPHRIGPVPNGLLEEGQEPPKRPEHAEPSLELRTLSGEDL